MGAIAESFVSYAQPLFDQSDGSESQMQRAMTIAQMCWNLALLPEDQRNAAIDGFKSSLEMADEDFTEFRQEVILPMIRRHVEMFPGLHSRSPQSRHATSAGSLQTMLHPAEKFLNKIGVMPPPPPNHPAARRNDPCQCGSGQKFKRCCGARK
ncbi:MAG: SEC-C domain-containing protein [Pirellulales bacterium]|nr:SEC-C domain-containing protein [Pirellulales bacterium]